MNYMVAYAYDEARQLCNVCVVDVEKSQVVKNCGTVNMADLGRLTVQYGVKPLNYSVDRNGIVAMDCGKFSRLKADNCGVVLAKIVSARAGRTLGFRVLSTSTLSIVNLRESEIIAREKSIGRAFLQNAIVRNDAVSCFQGHEFDIVKIADSTKKPEKHKKNPNPEEVQLPGKKDKHLQFTEEQMREIEQCRSNGVNVQLIYNAKYTPEQMHILWTAEKRGAVVSAFSSPSYPADVMQFYADRLLTNKIAKECGSMLSDKNLSVEQLSELYLCICEGVAYTDLIGKPAYEVQVERELRKKKFWGGFDEFDNYDKAVKYALSV